MMIFLTRKDTVWRYDFLCFGRQGFIKATDIRCIVYFERLLI